MPEDVPWSHFFCIRENFFQSFWTKLFSLLCMISFVNKICHCLSVNHNPELQCVICTGVSLFAPVLHFLHWCYTWTALLSANKNWLIFSCVLLKYLTALQFTVFLHWASIKHQVNKAPKICLRNGGKNIRRTFKNKNCYLMTTYRGNYEFDA